MDGKALAERIRGEVKQEIAELGRLGLATILAGADPASDIYIRRKHEAANEVGIESNDVRLPSETTHDELMGRIAALNADDSVDGILVQLPLPDHLAEARVITAIAP